jgi:hypothetical protein
MSAMTYRVLNAFLGYLHRTFRLPRESPRSWHKGRLNEELQELREAGTLVETIIEATDVLFTISRAARSGYAMDDRATISDFLDCLPLHWAAVAVVYMVGKFTLRRGFYLAAAYAYGLRGQRLREVRWVINLAKNAKLDKVAGHHGLDRDRFRRVAGRVLRWWPLLP